MSNFQHYRIPSVRLTAMKLVLLVAVADIAAGATLILHHSSAIMPDIRAGAPLAAMAYPLDESRSGAWHEVHQTISSSFVARSRLYDMSGAGITRWDATPPSAVRLSSRHFFED